MKNEPLIDKVRQISPDAVKLASLAIRNSKLEPANRVRRSDCIAVLAKTLLATNPRSPHGKLLMRSFRPVADDKQRSPEELSVRWLVKRAESPTPAAVAGRVLSYKTRGENLASVRQEANRIVDSDGYLAARLIADRIAETGESYTWLEVTKLMGWPVRKLLINEIFDKLRYLGWVETGSQTRSLRPGKRYLRLTEKTPV